jgi:NTP pyrophosphatase (non-canonical NTP hydrolase)
MANGKFKDPNTSATWVLSLQCLEDGQRWFGDQINPRDYKHHTLGLCGEVGEFANLIKKIDRGSLDVKSATVRHDLAMELTDVYVYLLNLAGIFGIDLEKSYLQVRAANEERFMKQRREREARG